MILWDVLTSHHPEVQLLERFGKQVGVLMKLAAKTVDRGARGLRPDSADFAGGVTHATRWFVHTLQLTGNFALSFFADYAGAGAVPDADDSLLCQVLAFFSSPRSVWGRAREVASGDAVCALFWLEAATRYLCRPEGVAGYFSESEVVEFWTHQPAEATLPGNAHTSGRFLLSVSFARELFLRICGYAPRPWTFTGSGRRRSGSWRWTDAG